MRVEDDYAKLYLVQSETKQLNNNPRAQLEGCGHAGVMLRGPYINPPPLFLKLYIYKGKLLPVLAHAPH